MKKFICMAILALVTLCASAQEQSDKDRAKEMYEFIQKEVDRYADALELSDSQIFYADSILTHNYQAIEDEFKALSDAKVSNTDIYYTVQDKWMEETYKAFRKMLNDDQWAKYLKIGAARDKKARDKRAAKALKK